MIIDGMKLGRYSIVYLKRLAVLTQLFELLIESPSRPLLHALRFMLLDHGQYKYKVFAHPELVF